MKQVLVVAWLFTFCLFTVEAYDSPVSQERISEIAKMLPEKPGVFYYPINNREAWDKLGKAPTFANIVSRAGSLLKKEFPKWDDEAYLEFSKIGTRPRGQKMMSDRSNWLSPLVWAECIENKGRFLPAIEMVLHEMTIQPTWTNAAHDRSLGCFKRTHYSVDLSSATFAHELAQALYLLGDKLSPEIVQEVKEALEIRIFNPMRRSFKTGSGNGWLRVTSNWNAVCLAGVTGAALASLEDVSDRALFVAMAEHFAKYSIKGFSEGGYCNEGVGYYNYGFKNYIILREVVLRATSGKLDLFSDPKVCQIASFGKNIQIIDDVAPAIADCRFNSKVDKRIVAYCDRALVLGLGGNPNALAPDAGRLATGCMYAELYPSVENNTTIEKHDNSNLQYYFEQVGVLICRPKKDSCRMGVALKGGNNAEHHNHNDVGSFSIQLGKELIVADPGGPHVYNSKTFTSERYDIHPSVSSFGHPVPVVNGAFQKPGRNAEAKVLRADLTAENDIFELDIKSAYSVEQLEKLTRKFVYNRSGAGKLIVTDDFSATEPIEFETALTTHGTWKQISDNVIVFSKGAESLKAEISGPSCGWEISDTTIKDSAPAYKRISIKLNKKNVSGQIIITFLPET